MFLKLHRIEDKITLDGKKSRYSQFVHVYDEKTRTSGSIVLRKQFKIGQSLLKSVPNAQDIKDDLLSFLYLSWQLEVLLEHI